MPKKAKSSGIWMRVGIQPPNMLTPLSFCSCMISAFMSLRLGSVTLYLVLYLSLDGVHLGLNALHLEAGSAWS